ncbi:Glutathione transferase [Heracleum sosnowskyi]|uniref:Probable glutathione S-transferase n=1 Tax=Heracleum sosnowskyi TaxID=360622 RepID=A0AAD8LXZ0_9APIA|nr:Glutathione transferase [Heracleum sosnowskyi]
MANQEVKLLGVWESPFSKRVEIALKMKGVEYENVEEDLSTKSPQLLKYNPIHKKVPVFLHNGKPIVESLVILEYIDETWKSGTPLLPQDPLERATSRFWAKFIDDKLLPAAVKFVGSKGGEQDVEEIVELLSKLENELKDKKFFGGESIGLVDIVGSIIALWIDVIQEAVGVEIFTKEKHPKLFKWSEDFMDCSIIKETLPPRADLLAFWQSRLQPSATSG